MKPSSKKPEPLPALAVVPRWAHFFYGGTGVTNITCDIPQRTAIYMQAAANLGLNGITVVNKSMDGRDWCSSLHDCRPHKNLSDFWAEVRRLESSPNAVDEPRGANLT